MGTGEFVSSDRIRTMFSRAMSDMYRAEVPQYGTLVDLAANPGLKQQLARADELGRLDVERHGAIRLGTPDELATTRRLFAVMGMVPVGYYDLSVAGVPVHSTAFRPIDDASLARNPFRVFTSLLRLDLIEDNALRVEAASILARRRIFTDGVLRLIETFETEGGLTESDGEAFVHEALETFRWHSEATVDADTYRKLHDAHRLIADVVSFRGPHINHLTPRTLDIDVVQAIMPRRGIAAKAVIEGPPTGACPILLRQTSFKALEERILFKAEQSTQTGSHTARFGEIEQRGIALTRKGRALYDELLASVRNEGGSGNSSVDYPARLAEAFRRFPDSYEEIRTQGLGFFRYALTGVGDADSGVDRMTMDDLIEAGFVKADPIVYEDFLPVSAAGIFQSNLGGTEQKSYSANANRNAFEAALGASVLDEFALYEQTQARSIEAVRTALRDKYQSSILAAPEGRAG
jgi:uncharacterized glyoxalase superfamily metalloenzyme YdcJ